jgi:hypothetical protein
MTTLGAAYDVSLTGGSNTIGGATTFNNTGTLTLGDAAGDTLAFHTADSPPRRRPRLQLTAR